MYPLVAVQLQSSVKERDKLLPLNFTDPTALLTFSGVTTINICVSSILLNFLQLFINAIILNMVFMNFLGIVLYF